jgi:hypothetical protein
MVKKWPVSPLLLSGFIVLALAANNIHEISIQDIWRPLFVTVAAGAVLFGLVKLFLHDWHLAALVTDIILLFFMLYGRVYDLGKNVTVAGFNIFRHRTLLALWVFLIGIAIFWVVSRIKDPPAATPWLNLFTALLLVYPVLTLTTGLIEQNNDNHSMVNTTYGAAQVKGDKPDIYYIILDAYGRQDILDHLGYDNTPFIAALKARGFYVAGCSQSNYIYTMLSLGSSLNYEYLDGIVTKQRTEMDSLIKNNKLRTFLESQGYQTVAFATGFQWTEWKRGDKYYPVANASDKISGFESMLIKTTMLRAPIDLIGIKVSGDEVRRATILSGLKNLRQVPKLPGSKFVFAHLVIPHGTYVFDAQGNPTEANGAQGYLDQVTFINNEILQAIDQILSDSITPPVIIIQGDHGPRDLLSNENDTPKILNAYYLPAGESPLYPTITPVNTFRVILNTYFGQNLPLLEDKSYFSPDETIDFRQVPIECP